MRELGAYGWVTSWEVRELFTATVHEARGLGVQDVNVRVARKSPVQPPERDFRQRAGIRILVLAVTAKPDNRRLEVGLSFPSGASTDAAETDRLLEHARQSFHVARFT